MTYICSDIHGEYELFLALLRYIRFSEKDEMIVCGDIIDKGTGSVKLIELLSGYRNFTFIVGNHEHDFLKYSYAVLDGSGSRAAALKTLRERFPDDGAALTWEHIEWLESQPYFLEREGFICVHSGVPLTKDGALEPVEEVPVSSLVYDRRFKEPSLLPKADKCVLFGHTPTGYLTGKHEIIAYPKIASPKKISDFYKIHLDIGTYLGGGVGCICVEDLTCHYVQANGQAYSKYLTR